MTAEGNWRPPDHAGVWRYGPAWMHPLVVAVPWLTLGLALAMFFLARETLVLNDGTDFALPEGALPTREVTGPVAVVMPGAAETAGAADGAKATDAAIVFFNDERHAIPSGAARLAERFAAAVSGHRDASLLLLADRRVRSGDLLQVVAAARRAGVRHVRVAGSPER